MVKTIVTIFFVSTFLSCASRIINNPAQDTDYRSTYLTLVKENRINTQVKNSCFKSSKSLNFMDMNRGTALRYYYDFYKTTKGDLDRVTESVSNGKYSKKYVHKSEYKIDYITKVCLLDGGYVVSIMDK